MSMEPFNVYARCSKCGGQLIDTIHHAGRACQLVRGEHIHRRCHGCGYEWAEQPLDSVRLPTNIRD